ncbi:MAG: excinuclease ABC subunit UvrA [Bacteroidota bacterium]
MPQEFISIRGARENNLKDISLDIPKRKITIFTGVSGSGKSSIVFDTIATEAQRLLNENFSMFVRNFLPKYPQPDADAIENLSMAVVVDQKRLGGGSHSTVGTITDIATVMRLLFSRVGKPHIGNFNLFSFNDPQGMCPECNGMGRKVGLDIGKSIDTSLSIKQGAILLPEYQVDTWGWNIAMQSGINVNKKVKDFTKAEMDNLLYSEPRKVKSKVGGKEINFTFEGIANKFYQRYILRDVKTMSERTQKQIEPFIAMGPCPLCKGARLSQSTLKCKIDGYNIAELSAMEISELIKIIKTVKDPKSTSIIQTLVQRLQYLVDIGLEYLSLNRETNSLSGGESQRIKMVKHLSGSLVDVMYIFDEPSVGLHPRDVHRMNELLVKLRDKGNTVLVVEHDPDVIKGADYIVDVGPNAGSGGGTIVYRGDFAGLLKSNTLTGKHMKRTVPIKQDVRKSKGKLTITKAKLNNLQNISVNIPTGVLTVVTGVAGSGKSSLINHVFTEQHPDAIIIDQSAVGANSRSNPGTYTGVLDDIRKLFATTNKVSPSLFSFNSTGACPNCQGLGVTYTDLAFLDEVKLPCEVCGGKRFKDEVLAYKYKGKSISDVLEMPAQQALEHFDSKEIVNKLKAMNDVGLTYLTLGQPLSTLSGGECQRIKLATELHKKGSIYVMDEPTTGLHMSDIGNLLAMLDQLVDDGNTVIVIEHNIDVIKNADWVIDMGPEGGNKGGKVVFEGPPAELVKAKGSLTGEYLKKHLN